MRVLVHAEVELAAIDGSTSWLMSIARCLAMAGADVDVMARNQPTRSIVLDELRSHPRVRVLYPNGAAMNAPEVVASAIAKQHARKQYDMVLVRGPRTAQLLCASADVRAVLWYYTVGLPSIEEAPFDGLLDLTREVAHAARGIFAQTPWLRDYLHALVPETVGKTEVLPPMVPDEFFVRRVRARGERVRIGYAGKFDRPWHTLEIPELVGQLDRRGVPAAVTMHGDKVQAAKGDPRWHVRMRALIADPPPGVCFPGALQRSRVPDFMAECDLGIGWRDAALDTSYEISTKLLEFSAAGVPVVCNDTAIHRSIFGEDYPLYVRDDIDQVSDRIARFLLAGDSLDALGRTVSEAVSDFSFTATAGRLRQLLTRVSRARSLRDAGVRSVAYLHEAGYPSGELIRGTALVAQTDVIGVNQLKSGRAEVGRPDLLMVDLSRRAMDALPRVDCPVIGYVAPGVNERGLINAHRLSGLNGVISADADILAMVARVNPRCRRLEVDPAALVATVDDVWHAPASGKLSIVLARGDVDASARLSAELPKAIRAAEGLCRVSVVVLEPWRWDGAPPRPMAHRVARDVQHALAAVATADVEVLSIDRHDSRWLAQTALLLELGQRHEDRSLASVVARNGGTLLTAHGARIARRPAAAVARHLTREVLAQALARHRVARPQPTSERDRLERFVEQVALAADGGARRIG